MTRFLILLSILGAQLTTVVTAQVANERIYHQNPDKIKLFGKNGEQTMAWSGGVNAPQFAMADLNRDGKNDLVIFEAGGMPRTFLFVGPGAKYKFAPKYASKFTQVLHYIKLVDYDRDGIPDLFHFGPQSAGGAAVCKGYYNDDSQLCYDQCKDIRYAVPHSGMVNIGIGSGYMPAYADVDGDEDIDILVYSPSGSLMKLYKNFQFEDKLPKDAFRYDLVDECWGKVEQKENFRTHNLSFKCSSSPKPDGTSQQKTTGGSHGICLLDGDGDGDLDVLDATNMNSDIQYLENGRNIYGRDTMISQDTMWQSGKKTLIINSYPVAYWLDIDNDGDKDILVSPFMAKTENYRSIHFYKNEGSDASPSFNFKTDTLLVDDMIDVGENAFPALFDYNKDGKLDLFVGTGGYYQPGGNKAKLAYYKNTSTMGQNGFAAETSDFMGLNSLNLSYAAPAFGDVDGDGKDDMVIGKKDGRLLYFKNTAASNNDVPVWTQSLGNLMAGSTEVNVGGYAAPFIYDFNKDGLKDLIIGAENGKLAYYENLGPSAGGKPSLRLVTDSLGSVDVSGMSSTGYSVPFLGKIDNSGKEYLLVGTNKGSIYRYSFQHGQANTPFTLIEENYSDTKVALYTGFAAPAVFDVDGDNRYEMMVGTQYGGLMLYEQMFATGVPEIAQSNKLRLYPNPATSELTIDLPASFKDDHSGLRIYNHIGQTVQVSASLTANGQLNADVSLLPAGLYMCTLVVDDVLYSGSFIKN